MTHIERLLLVHDCVIIPGVGGFVLQNHPASFLEKSGTFMPARKEIVFNPTLRHNDGLLTESYMKLYGVDYRKALAMQEEDTTELKSALKTKRRITLGTMGVFVIDGESVSFEPGQTDLFSVSSYGLAEFHIPILQTLQQEMASKAVQKQTAKDIVYIPVNRRFLRVVVSSAAAIALFFLLSTPVKEVDSSVYTASFIPSEVVAKVSPEPKAAEVLESVVSPELPVVPLVAAVVEPLDAKSEAVAIQGEKVYHIIIASFPEKIQANKYLQGVNPSLCTNAGIVERSGKVRIYADKFTDKQQAELYLSNLKTHPEYKDAWMFIAR